MNTVWRIGRAGLECAAVAGYVYVLAVLLLVRAGIPLCLLTVAGSVAWGWLTAHRLRCSPTRFPLAALVPGLLAVLSLGMGVLTLISLLEWGGHSFLGVLS